MTPRSAAVAVLAVSALTGACTDRTGDGLPDLDEIDPSILEIDVTVSVGPDGCTPADLEIDRGSTVGLVATADGVRVRSGDDVFDTGVMRAGETVEWYLHEPVDTTIVCGLDGDERSTGPLVVSPPTG